MSTISVDQDFEDIFDPDAPTPNQQSFEDSDSLEFDPPKKSSSAWWKIVLLVCLAIPTVIFLTSNFKEHPNKNIFPQPTAPKGPHSYPPDSRPFSPNPTTSKNFSTPPTFDPRTSNPLPPGPTDHIPPRAKDPLDPVPRESTPNFSQSPDSTQGFSQRVFQKGPWRKEEKRFWSFSTPVLNWRYRILCSLFGKTKQHYCQSQYIAESIDLMYVVCPIYSFGKRFDSLLYDLHVQFQNYVKSFGIPFVTFEAIKYQSNERYVLTKPNNEPFEMQGYYRNASYLRENLLNVAIGRLNKTVDWEYVAWIDAHHVFENLFWWEDAIYKSEHFMMVQLFADSIRWNYVNHSILHRPGFVQTSIFMWDINLVGKQIEFGNAHVLSRESYEKIGYIHDECFASGCDWAYMQASLPPGTVFLLEPLWPHYNQTHQGWLNKVLPIVNGSRAYVPGKIFHLDHKSTFHYGRLRDLVERSDYNITTDFHRDENGVFYLSNYNLTRDIEDYYLNHY